MPEWLPTSAESLVFQGLLGSALGFLSSVLGTIALIWSHRRQAGVAKEIETHKAELTRQIEDYKAQLARENRRFEVEMQNAQTLDTAKLNALIGKVEVSQVAYIAARTAFKELVGTSLSAQENDFLSAFQKAIAAHQALTVAVSDMNSVVHARDLIVINRLRKFMLQILLGMRLEKSRREQDDFRLRVPQYQASLERLCSIVDRKYQNFLQLTHYPRRVKGERAAPKSSLAIADSKLPRIHNVGGPASR